MLEPDFTLRVEEHVHNGALRWGEHDFVHERFALKTAAVSADELRARTTNGEVEDPGICSVHDVEAHDLSEGSSPREFGPPIDEHDVPEPPHGSEVRTRPKKGCDVA